MKLSIVHIDCAKCNTLVIKKGYCNNLNILNTLQDLDLRRKEKSCDFEFLDLFVTYDRTSKFMPVPSKQTTNHGRQGDAREIGARSCDIRCESHVRENVY